LFFTAFTLVSYVLVLRKTVVYTKKGVISFSLSLYLPEIKKNGKCGRERVTSLEKNGRYNTKWQLCAFKYSHDWPYRRERSCWKKRPATKNDEQLFDFKSGLCIIQQKPNCSNSACGSRKDGGIAILWAEEKKEIRAPQPRRSSYRND